MKASELNHSYLGEMVLISVGDDYVERGTLVECEHGDVAVEFSDGQVFHLNDQVDIAIVPW